MEDTFEWNYQDERLLKPCEVARLLNISKSMSYRLIQTGKIPCIRINHAVRIDPNDLKNFIQSQRITDLSISR